MKHIENAKVKSITRYEKCSFMAVGSGKIWFWNDAPFASQIEENAVLTVDCEERTNKNGEKAWWAVKVNGIGEKPEPKPKAVLHKEDPERIASIERQCLLKEERDDRRTALREACLDARQALMAGKPLTDEEVKARFEFYIALLKG